MAEGGIKKWPLGVELNQWPRVFGQWSDEDFEISTIRILRTAFKIRPCMTLMSQSGLKWRNYNSNITADRYKFAMMVRVHVLR
jgi:hypothetical protein